MLLGIISGLTTVDKIEIILSIGPTIIRFRSDSIGKIPRVPAIQTNIT